MDAQDPYDAGLGFLVVRAIAVVGGLRHELTDLTGPRQVSATTVRLPFGRTHVPAVGGVGGDAVAAGDQGGLPEEQIGREVAQ